MDARETLGKALTRARMLWAQKVETTAKACGVQPIELQQMEAGKRRVPDTVLAHYVKSFRLDMGEIKTLRNSGDR